MSTCWQEYTDWSRQAGNTHESLHLQCPLQHVLLQLHSNHSTAYVVEGMQLQTLTQLITLRLGPTIIANAPLLLRAL